MALEDRRALEDFAARSGLASPLYARVRHPAGPTWVLLLGVYPDQSEAEAAARSWTASHAGAEPPWIRPVGGLQQVLER
jgi:septal ring-binding cell division protein DamX